MPSLWWLNLLIQVGTRATEAGPILVLTQNTILPGELHCVLFRQLPTILSLESSVNITGCAVSKVRGSPIPIDYGELPTDLRHGYSASGSCSGRSSSGLLSLPFPTSN